jgi:hypothetical protein
MVNCHQLPGAGLSFDAICSKTRENLFSKIGLSMRKERLWMNFEGISDPGQNTAYSGGEPLSTCPRR